MASGDSNSVEAYIGLGSNLGDREGSIRSAITLLASTPQIVLDPSTDVATLRETEPVGGPADQGAFINTVARISTTLSPHELLAVALDIEKTLGRERCERWGPRVIDLDILLYGDVVLSDDRLTLPHPRMHERLFVLVPLSELAPKLLHPVLGQTIRDVHRLCLHCNSA